MRLIAGVLTEIWGVCRRQIQSELFEIVCLAILVKPAIFSKEVLDINFAFSDVAFSERSMQGERMSDPLNFPFRRIIFVLM